MDSSAVDMGRTDVNDDDCNDEIRLARGATHVPDAERQLSRAPRGRELYTRETGIDRTGACARPLSWSSFSTSSSPLLSSHPPLPLLPPATRDPQPFLISSATTVVLILPRATHPRPLATTTIATAANGPD